MNTVILHAKQLNRVPNVVTEEVFGGQGLGGALAFVSHSRHCYGRNCGLDWVENGRSLQQTNRLCVHSHSSVASRLVAAH